MFNQISTPPPSLKATYYAKFVSFWQPALCDVTIDCSSLSKPDAPTERRLYWPAKSACFCVGGHKHRANPAVFLLIDEA